MRDNVPHPDFVLPPPPPASVAVHNSTARFPVRRIICVGRNYAAHAREMGRDPDREPPFFFLKPTDAVVDDGTTVPYPPLTKNFHYEIELIVAIAHGGTDIPVERALDHVWGYGVGIDLTRRDLQLQAREQGRPWDWGKGFDRSAPIAPLRPAFEVGHPKAGRIWLAVDGHSQARSRYLKADLAGARHHLNLLAVDGTRSRRHHNDRHAGRRGPRAARRNDDRGDPWAGRDQDRSIIAQTEQFASLALQRTCETRKRGQAGYLNLNR